MYYAQRGYALCRMVPCAWILGWSVAHALHVIKNLENFVVTTSD